jgi:AraC-like DNA-binding protein
VRTWQTIRPSVLGRHVHQQPYAALVLSGCYEEAGDTGRHRVSAGDVVFHQAFEAHLDRIPASGAEILNLPLPPQHPLPSSLGRTSDPDAIVALSERSEHEAAALLLWLVQAREPEHHDWPDELAADLIQNTSLNLSNWSETTGIAAWNLSRGFAKIFGLSPCAFRARTRVRQAWNAICSTDASLSAIAAEYGFADQAHMTRGIKNMTGLCPTAWRSRCK